jgi:hypothetical protein
MAILEYAFCLHNTQKDIPCKSGNSILLCLQNQTRVSNRNIKNTHTHTHEPKGTIQIAKPKGVLPCESR